MEAVAILKECCCCGKKKIVVAFFLDVEEGFFYVCHECFFSLSEEEKKPWQKI